LFPVDIDINHVSPSDFDEFMLGERNRILLENGLIEDALRIADEAKMLGWKVGRFWKRGVFKIF